VQAILVYLIVRMTKPIQMDDGEDDTSSVSQDKREQDLTML
jgi:hypothetical protein